MKELLKALGIKQIVGLDFETYYDNDYTLRKMSTTEYVRDPRFKVQSVSLQTHRQKGGKGYGTADSISRAIHDVDWDSTGLLCHHTHFDGLILSHHFGIVPGFYLCTLSMARPIHGGAIKNDLDTVAQHYGVGNKLEDILGKTKGVRDIPPDLLKRLIEYNNVDVDIM